MLTWTTYGSWLQGDSRGYVKGGEIIKGDESLENINRARLDGKVVQLSTAERKKVKSAILNEAKELGQIIHCVAVKAGHVHLVVNCIDEEIGRVAGRYKRAATFALRENGFEGKVWTRGYDKRYCFDVESLEARMRYVGRH
jgi:REP element-mobilizing transposase RayT